MQLTSDRNILVKLYANSDPLISSISVNLSTCIVCCEWSRLLINQNKLVVLSPLLKITSNRFRAKEHTKENWISFVEKISFGLMPSSGWTTISIIVFVLFNHFATSWFRSNQGWLYFQAFWWIYCSQWKLRSYCCRCNRRWPANSQSVDD